LPSSDPRETPRSIFLKPLFSDMVAPDFGNGQRLAA
jgi:hypothetical protein